VKDLRSAVLAHDHCCHRHAGTVAPGPRFQKRRPGEPLIPVEESR
jgi:hypothetical protein